MPRNHHPGASTLRNRNRITNKTRLKIHHGNIDADPLLIPDEDEEKHRLTNLVAGVDAEDANEHHLQQVLSAASQRSNFNANRPTRGATEKTSASAAPVAYIPTPDSTGIVDNYEELYPANRWKDPATYISSSTTVEESTANALANGFTYYMDERDKEWLDKNNEEARGEGTSAQGAVSASGTRTSARSAKAKGKEPEASQPVVVSEDEFELVMGLFEKVTHEKTEYLHHGLETGMSFPAFSEYQETFSSPLLPTAFATYTVLSWIPSPATLVRIARAVYPYWRERRIERGGHRIIPILNGDETDTLNESYICFRRREIKAVRKTRASQVTSSDKLARLQTEFSYPLELAKSILARENIKKDCAVQAQSVWEKRLALVDLKRKFPTLGDKADEELLIDKERPVKKPELSRIPGLKIRTHDSGLLSARPEVAIRPKDRTAMIREQIETALQQQKEHDHHWDDMIDNVYQPLPVPYTSRLFKYVPPPDTPSWPLDVDEEPPAPVQHRSVRLRYGRGGRILVDRRHVVPRTISKTARRSALLGSQSSDDEPMDVDEDDSDVELRRRLSERWKYDADDMPAVGPQGSDEQDRVLVDDYDSKYLRHSMTLFADPDQQSLITDPSLLVAAPDGRQQMVVPFRLGMSQPMMRRDAAGVARPYPPGAAPMISQQGVPLSLPVNGTPISVQQQLKKMAPPAGLSQLRISSNGGMRPPGIPVVASMPSNIPSSHASPPHLSPVSQHSPTPTNSANGINRPAMNMPHVDAVKPELPPSIPDSTPQAQQPQQLESALQIVENHVNGINHANSPARPKSQNQHTTTNGYHLTPMNGYTVAALANATPYAQHPTAQHNVLSSQQVQNLKSAFANMAPGQDIATAIQVNSGRAVPPYMHVVPSGPGFGMPGTNGNINLKLPAARQMQWSVGSPMQRPNSAVNGLDGQPVNSPSPNLNPVAPVRSPSANGLRPVMQRHINGQINGHMSSPHIQQSPPPMPQSISQSPPRLPITPTMTMSSPSLQHQQPVGGPQSGY